MRTKPVKRDETIGDLLDTWSAKEPMGDRGIAIALGISISTVEHWRNLHSAPNWNMWPRFAACSGRSVEDVALAIARGVKAITTNRTGATVPA